MDSAFLVLSASPRVFPSRFTAKDPVFATLALSPSPALNHTAPGTEHPGPSLVPTRKGASGARGPLQDPGEEGRSGVGKSKRQKIQNSFPLGWGMFTL